MCQMKRLDYILRDHCLLKKSLYLCIHTVSRLEYYNSSYSINYDYTFVHVLSLFFITYYFLVNEYYLLGGRTESPKFCISANISASDKGEHVLNMHRLDCSLKLEWFICKEGKKKILCCIYQRGARDTREIHKLTTPGQ